MAKSSGSQKKAGRSSKSGSLMNMRKGFRGMVRGGGKPTQQKPTSFWNVLTWLVVAFAALLLVMRLAS